MSALAKSDEYLAEVERWHRQRIERLTAPDGWLSLVGLEWLHPGVNRIGSAGDNDIVLTGAPAHVGSVAWRADGTLTFTLDPASGARIDDGDATQVVMADDNHPVPTTVAFGTVRFIAIDRGGRKGLRVRDSAAPTRTAFRGVGRFPVDPAWRVVADWVPFDPPFELATNTVIGTVETYPAPGKAVFARDGQTFAAYPVLESAGDKQLFLIFADATSGRETYGAARFLYVDMPHDGRIVLDFNKACNPPCSFTAHATCPLAPPENRMALRITAGELKPGDPHGLLTLRRVAWC